MKIFTTSVIVIVGVISGCCTGAFAWDVEYDASGGVLPSQASPAWQTDSGSAAILSGVLSIDSTGACYEREGDALGVGVPVTVETSMRASSSAYDAWISLGTYGGATGISIYSDRIETSGINGQPLVFLLTDPTAFHTIRLAYDGNGDGAVWVDNQFALPIVTEPWNWSLGPPDGVRFGSYLAESDWQYVDYSKEFLPVPEPSSFAALGAGLLPLAGLALWRKKRQSDLSVSAEFVSGSIICSSPAIVYNLDTNHNRWVYVTNRGGNGYLLAFKTAR